MSRRSIPGRPVRVVALACLASMLVSAADPASDVVGCRSGATGGAAPDLVSAEGRIVEVGTSARWTLTFAEPLVVPDAEGRPFRVDIAIRDPDVPAVSFAYFHRVNRIVRVDATVEHPTEILLLPEQGTNVFNPPAVEDRTMTIQVPGRILTDDEDLTGTSPGLEALRWTVIVRDGRSCDPLGDGRPVQRLIAAPEPPDASAAPGTPDGSGGGWLVAGVVVAGVAVAGAALALYRSRRAR